MDKKFDSVTLEPTLAIPLMQALEIVQAAVPGELQGAELETEKGQSIWEVEILDANGQEVELAIEASDGSVLSQKIDDDKHEHDRKHDD